MIGLRRYVHIAFAVAALLATYILSNIFVLIGGWVGWSYSFLGFDIWSVFALFVSVSVAITLWRNPKIFGFVEQVADELKKVTWPTYEETRSATWVVIVMVAVFSVALGIFDFLVAGFTDLVVGFLS